MVGSGMDTRSFPFLPIISPRLMYFDRLLLTLPRTSLRNRWRSCSIFCPTVVASADGMGHRIWESYQTGGVRVKRSRRVGLTGAVRAESGQHDQRGRGEGGEHGHEGGRLGRGEGGPEPRAALGEALTPGTETVVGEHDEVADNQSDEPGGDANADRGEPPGANADGDPAGAPHQAHGDGERLGDGH